MISFKYDEVHSKKWQNKRADLSKYFCFNNIRVKAVSYLTYCLEIFVRPAAMLKKILDTEEVKKLDLNFYQNNA